MIFNVLARLWFDKETRTLLESQHYFGDMGADAGQPASTSDGILAKLEVWQRIEMWTDTDSRALDDLDIESRAAVSVLCDARRLVRE